MPDVIVPFLSLPPSPPPPVPPGSADVGVVGAEDGGDDLQPGRHALVLQRLGGASLLVSPPFFFILNAP